MTSRMSRASWIARIVSWIKGDTTTGLRLPWRMFWVGLAVRILYITLAHSYHFRTFLDHFQFGWEDGRIARALVTGYGFAAPFTGHTGPTALSSPPCGRLQTLRHLHTTLRLDHPLSQ